MKILVLGSKGMLGSEFMRSMNNYELISGHDINITSLDLKYKIEESNPDVVINCAAYTNVDACETEEGKEKCLAVNGYALGNLVKACEFRNIKIVHFSTDYVFDGAYPDGYKENSICNPANMYGFSKRIGELQLTKNYNNYLLIRSEWLYGKDGKNFVDTILERTRAGLELNVVNHQFGSPTSTTDLVIATERLLNLECCGTYHFTNRGIYSWYSLVKEILKIAKIDTSVNPIKSSESGRLANRPVNSMLNCFKYYNDTNNHPTSCKSALIKYLTTIL